MKIDLGKKIDGPCCPVPSGSNNTYYPSLYLEGTGSLKDIPESGTLTIRFKRVSQTERERNGDKSCSVELEVREIIGADAGDAETEKSGEDALDELAKALKDGDYEDEDKE